MPRLKSAGLSSRSRPTTPIFRFPRSFPCTLNSLINSPSFEIDTFDMKPNAPAEIRGPFKPIKTNNPDIQISEVFPLHAKLADKFSLVRDRYLRYEAQCPG